MEKIVIYLFSWFYQSSYKTVTPISRSFFIEGNYKEEDGWSIMRENNSYYGSDNSLTWDRIE